MNRMIHPLSRDLDFVLDQTAAVWPELRGGSIFITGGTGFFGCWLLESFAWANDKLHLDAQAVVLTRNPEAFREKAPRLACHPSVRLLPGDVRDFDFPSGSFSHVIHAAAESASGLNERDPLAMLDHLAAGTRHVLDFAVACGARKFLLTSSGAVYGQQPPEVSHLPESWHGAPDPVNPRSAYAEGKRTAELLCAIYNQRYGLETRIARGFAFVGPYLPLDKHFAIGNFIRDGLAGGPIRVSGDGTPVRSYLYAADLAAWLWTILARGEPCRPYNVGSEAAMSIAETARAVAAVSGLNCAIEVAGRPAVAAAHRYVPSTARAQGELGLRQLTRLEEGIRRTLEWNTAHAPNPSEVCPC